VNQNRGDRDAILGRVREALREEAPLKHPAERSAGGEPTTAHFREWLPPVGASIDERYALFAKLSESLRTELHLCADMAEVSAFIKKLSEEGNWKTIALHTGELISPLISELPPQLTPLILQSGYDKDTLEACDAGLTECDRLKRPASASHCRGAQKPASHGSNGSVRLPRHKISRCISQYDLLHHRPEPDWRY